MAGFCLGRLVRRLRGPGSRLRKPISLPLESSRSLRLFGSSALPSSSIPGLRRAVRRRGVSLSAACGILRVLLRLRPCSLAMSRCWCLPVQFGIPCVGVCCMRCTTSAVLALCARARHHPSSWTLRRKSHYCGRMAADFRRPRTRGLLWRTAAAASAWCLRCTRLAAVLHFRGGWCLFGRLCETFSPRQPLGHCRPQYRTEPRVCWRWVFDIPFGLCATVVLPERQCSHSSA